MEKSVATLDQGTTCSSWNYCRQRMAAGSNDGMLSIFDSVDPASSSFTPSIRFKVAAYSDGHVKVYELLDPLELKNWQLQAEFQNVADSVSKFGKAACLSASISWSPQDSESQQMSFVLGFNSNVAQLNSAKVWEFDQDHQRWLPVAELASNDDKGDPVYAVAWAPNIGRPQEVIAVATHKGISIWHLGLNPDQDGRLPVEKVALLSGHESEVWQMEWDMSGMTLATSGGDDLVKLWQSNLNGVWQEQAAFKPTRPPPNLNTLPTGTD